MAWIPHRGIGQRCGCAAVRHVHDVDPAERIQHDAQQVVDRAFIDSNETYGPRPVNLFSDVVGALAKAKQAGFEP